MPGASPTINNCPSGSPKTGTGALNQPGSRCRASSRKAASLGQSGQFRSGWFGKDAGGLPPISPLVADLVVIAPRYHGGRALQELRRMMTRFARSRAFGRVAAELGLQFHEVGEDVGLTPQFIGNHRWLAAN